MKIAELSLAQMARTGCTHRFELTFADLVATAGTTLTIALTDLLAKGTKVENVCFKVVTLFDGGATTNLTLQLGYDVSAGTDAASGLMAPHSIHADATYYLSGPNVERARLSDGVTDTANTLQRSATFQEAGSITALLTSTTANLSTLTQGEVHVFARIAAMV